MVNIHTREITDNLASLVKQIDSLVDDAKAKGKDKKHAFVVLLTDDADAAEPKLEALAKKHEIKNTPLTIFDGISGPKGYKIAKNAEVTVMVWVNKKVEVNHAFGKGELDAEAVKKVLANAKKYLQ